MSEPRNPPLEGLRERRLFRRITQEEMGAVIDVNQPHYRQIESGGVRLDIQRAHLLAVHLKCTIEDLL
jgi:DNA-binding XRE family transcriptional regulator